MFVLLTMLIPSAEAQVMHISGNVYQQMKNMEGGLTKTPLQGAVIHVFDNAGEAQRQAQAYRAQGNSLSTGNYVEIKSNDVVKPDFEGHFEADISSSGALLVTYQGTVKLVKMTKSLNYDIVMNTTSDFILKDVDVLGKRKGVQVKELPPVDDGPNLHWNVSIAIPSHYTNKNSRLIFQPMVVDCQEEDTIQHLEPVVIEGERYHKNQIRRKSFDFNRNDSLSPYYNNSTSLTGSEFTFKWETTYPKPDPDKSYKWVSDIRVADYTHVYYQNDTHQGTCNSRKPWKMLDLGFAAKSITLDDRYYEQARAKLREIPRDLQLTFMLGRDVLTSDSANQQIIRQLVKELRSYGRQLINVKIQGTASPEGSVHVNTDLANRRAQKALSMIGPYVQGAGMQVAPAKVFTWNDVADSLEARGFRLEAGEMRQYAQRNAIGSINEMRSRLGVIEEIMKNQRLMKCSYTLRQNKVLDPEEALWTWRNDKNYGDFSNGDYYNLFRQISDKNELQTLTKRAWDVNRVRKTARYSAFAAYLANRVACDAIEHDSIDTSILEPFIDMRAGLEVTRPISFDNGYMYTVNRREIVANQAIMYFKQSKLGEAQHLANKLPDTPEYRDIKMFTDLETLFFKANKTAEEQQRADAALQYVMQTSETNRVVLLFELAPELGKTFDEIEPMVDALPDDNPRKWYMKTVIASTRADQDNSGGRFMELVNKYGAEEALRMTENKTPDFLGYLQKTLDLDESYYGKYYVSDSNIGDEVRKKYPYDKKRADEYRALFKSLTEQRNASESEEGGETAQ